MKHKSLCIGLVVCIKVMLDIIFSQFIANTYSYYGYVLEKSIIKSCVMWGELFLYIPFCIMFINGNSLKHKIMMFISLMYFLPGLSIFQFIKIDILMFIAWNVFWWMLIIVGAFPVIRIKSLLPAIKSRLIVRIIILCVALIVFLISWRYAGLRFTITFTDEYSLRAEERKIVLSKFISYLYASAPIVLSLGLALSVKRKKYGFSIVLIVLQIVNFSIGGHKTILLLTIISIGIIILGEIIDTKKRDSSIVLVMAIELLFEIIQAVLFESKSLMANISRRVYFIPQILNVHYYSYFSLHGYDFYARGPARLFGAKSKFDSSLPNIISRVYFGTDGNANNGLFSEAYSNLGLWGCVVLPLIICMIISILNYFVKDMDYTLTTLYAFLCAFTWGSGNVTTGLLTNGLLLSAIIIYLIPKGDINGN